MTTVSGSVRAALLAAAMTLAACDSAPTGAQPAPGASTPNYDRAALIDYLVDNPDIIEEAIGAFQGRMRGEVIADNRAAIETPFPGAVQGAEDADVTIVEFFDYACPYCKRSHGDVQRLLKEDPKLRVVYRNMPVLGPNSRRAAEVALAAAQEGKYSAFHNEFFEDERRNSDEKIRDVATDVGMAPGIVDLARNREAVTSEIDKNLALARQLNIGGTPAYVIGDEMVDGAVGYDALKSAVERARRSKASASAATR